MTEGGWPERLRVRFAPATLHCTCALPRPPLRARTAPHKLLTAYIWQHDKTRFHILNSVLLFFLHPSPLVSSFIRLAAHVLYLLIYASIPPASPPLSSLLFLYSHHTKCHHSHYLQLILFPFYRIQILLLCLSFFYFSPSLERADIQLTMVA